MRGTLLESIGQVRFCEVDDPRPPEAGEALLKVDLTTVCGSDVHLVHGTVPSEPPYVLGHEYVGTVQAVGAGVVTVAPGDRVVGPPAPWCGGCAMCRRGQFQKCRRGGVFGSGPTLGGSMAEALLVPHADQVLSHIPEGVTDEQALLVGDVLSTGLTAVRQVWSGPGAVLLVLGCGPVGLSAVHTARLFGPRAVIAVDMVPGRLELASRLGADHVVDAGTGDLADVVAEATDGFGVDGVVEAVGLPTTIGQAVELAAVGGRIAVVGIPAGSMELPMPQTLLKNLQLWTGLGDVRHMDMLLGLIARGVLDPSPMITHRSTLAQTVEAIEQFSDPASGVIKYAISPH